MFNSTHTLLGFALARSGMNRWAPHATATAVIASNLPDIDIITQLFGTATYLDLHRGLTHSMLGITVLSAALSAVMSIRRRELFWKYLALSLAVMATHPVLDWTNTYGVHPFQPFSGRWFYGDLLFVIDPYLDLILLLGVVASYRMTRRSELGARMGLMMALVYVGGLIELRSIARRQLAGYLADAPVIRSAVGPEFLYPFRWSGLVETAVDVTSLSINTRTGEVRVQNRMQKAEESTVTQAAASTYAGSVFRGFARFPVTRVLRTSTGYRVLMFDLRFFRPTLQTALSAEILLDGNLHVVSESMSFVRPID